MLNGSYYTVDNALYIGVTNLSEFDELIQKALGQAEELQKTMKELERYNIRVVIEDRRNDAAQK